MANEYPCATCTKVEDHANCDNKRCGVWKTWFVETWDATRNALSKDVEKQEASDGK